MRVRLRPWHFAALLALMCLVIVGAVYVVRGRSVIRPVNLVAYLPTRDAVIVYLETGAIRRSGLLDMLAGAQASEEPEYRQFVRQTAFDYQKDLDAVAFAFHEDTVYVVMRGRFHWRSLINYAIAQGGSCHNSYCAGPASKPGRYVSFYPIRTDLMGLSVSAGVSTAHDVHKDAGKLEIFSPDQPAWVLVPAVALSKPSSLPAVARPFASALRGAQEIFFAIGPAQDGLQLALTVTCNDQISASALLVELETATNSLRKLASKQGQEDAKPDLAAVLTRGVFRREDRRVHGAWSVPRSVIDSAMNGSF